MGHANMGMGFYEEAASLFKKAVDKRFLLRKEDKQYLAESYYFLG